MGVEIYFKLFQTAFRNAGGVKPTDFRCFGRTPLKPDLGKWIIPTTSGEFRTKLKNYQRYYNVSNGVRLENMLKDSDKYSRSYAEEEEKAREKGDHDAADKLQKMSIQWSMFSEALGEEREEVETYRMFVEKEVEKKFSE